MPEEGELTPVTSISEAARSLRNVLDLLLQDMSLTPVDPATLPWDRPIFVLRSANMARLQALLDVVMRQRPAPTLHIMSHARDEDAIRRMAPCDVTFHAYPTPGRYRLEEVPAAMLDRLRGVGFGSLLFLDTGPWGDFYDEVERLLPAIAEERMVSFLDDGTFARAPDAHIRKLAEPAFFRLVEWYQGRLAAGLSV